jgi:hypothetical protein
MIVEQVDRLVAVAERGAAPAAAADPAGAADAT